MIFKRLNIDSTLLNFFMAIYFVAVLNVTLITDIIKIFKELPQYNTLFALSVPIFLVSVFNIVFIFFSAKYIQKPFFALLIVISSVVSFAMYNYRTIFDPDMITNIVETDMAESTSYLNLPFVLWFMLTGLVPATVLMAVRVTHYKLVKDTAVKFASILVSVTVIGLLAVFFYKDYASTIRNNSGLRREIVPTYYITSSFKYVKQTYFYSKEPYTYIGQDAKLSDASKNNLIVVVVGETARAQNNQLNGYERPTNQYTKDIDNMIYVKDASSCGTSTAVSVPCMLSLMNRVDYSKKKFENQDNAIDIIKRAGVDQLWLDNNSSCKGACRSIGEVDTDKNNHLYCDGETCTDEVFLSSIKDYADKNKGKNGVIYLHLMGSHGPSYYKRIPEGFAKFKPTCDKSDIQNCSNDELRNTYDNTILHTDYVLSEIVKMLKGYDKDYNTALIYASDHGESIGEDGIYLHGIPYSIAPKEQTTVPMMFWMSDKYITENKIDYSCFKSNLGKSKMSHDNLSHMILDFVGVESSAVDTDLDKLYSCRAHKDIRS